MNRDVAIKTILSAPAFFEHQSAGYRSWGKVTVSQMAIKTDTGEIILSDATKPLVEQTAEDIRTDTDRSDIFHRIFTERTSPRVILLNSQEYASQVTREIPPILDDQAQLIGLTIRIARDDKDILHALDGRYAAILPDGRSICIGPNLDDTYVAAQLMEKSSKTFIEAECLGGAKAINKIEAWIMQKYYQFKYSKQARKNK